VPAGQLPSYVDDVLEVANYAALPGTGETGKIYVALDTNLQYRWSGSAYIQLVPSPGTTDALTEGSTNLYFTGARVLASVLTGLSLATNAAITATDTVLSAAGKLQKQITDLIASLSSYAPLASPALSGTPTAPTASSGTNTTQIATTAFVTAAVAGGGGSGSVDIRDVWLMG